MLIWVERHWQVAGLVLALQNAPVIHSILTRHGKPTVPCLARSDSMFSSDTAGNFCITLVVLLIASGGVNVFAIELLIPAKKYLDFPIQILNDISKFCDK